MPHDKITSAQDMQAAICTVIEMRALDAAQSAYDRSVCIAAVAAARACVERVSVEGSALDYGKAVLATLEPVYDTYHDPDGEFTSGKASIGDVYSHIARLVDAADSSGT